MDQSPVNDVNGRPVSRDMLNDKLEVIRAEMKVESQEQKTQHFKTRILILILGLATGIPTIVTKAIYILGYFN